MELYTHKNMGTTEERGDDAIRTIRAGVQLTGEIMKSTLGPKGSLKIIQGKIVSITNDGAFILKNLLIENPSSKIIADGSINQDKEEGDGTTSIAILTTLLLENAYRSTVHPSCINRGFSMALKKALDILSRRKYVAKPEDIRNLVKTTLNSKVLSSSDLNMFVDICIGASEKVEDIDSIEIIKMKGSLDESQLVDGFVLRKEIEINIADPKVLVANTSLDYDKIKIMSSKINVKRVRDIAEIEEEEKKKMYDKIEAITKIPFDVFINRQIIYDYPLQLLKNKSVKVVENANFEGVERLNRILGGNLISSFENMSENDLGTCKKISNIIIKDEKMLLFQGIKKGSATIIIHGSSEELLEEVERSVHDALCVLQRLKKHPECVYGGGCIEMGIALELHKYALEVKTKEAEGIEYFARSLMEIPKILAENCGYDGDEIKAMLKSDHNYRRTTYGVNVENGKTGCMRTLGVIEGYSMKKNVLISACETARSILKCDGIVRCPLRERTRH